MTATSVAVRATHLLTNAAWFGGSLMGAVALNPAAREAGSERDQAEVSGTGWERWGPVQGAAIGLHLLSGLGIIADNRRRTRLHAPTRNAVIAKTALTGAALATTAGSWWYGEKLGAEHIDDPADDVTQADRANARRQLKWLQWATPVLTGSVLVLDAYLGEKQRGLAGLLDRIRS